MEKTNIDFSVNHCLNCKALSPLVPIRIVSDNPVVVDDHRKGILLEADANGERLGVAGDGEETSAADSSRPVRVDRGGDLSGRKSEENPSPTGCQIEIQIFEQNAISVGTKNISKRKANHATLKKTYLPR
ncbi:hypothetical protein Salat_2251700 [Sesamum alatum]|uniref:Uncharacterized protein n=1 Tax=Sesamum alatum TaxID=300844 RepID=A0AAE1XUR3_9LAMI|nr:hypothetical protein Salat_2251700 [Sesamum alatum]